MMGRVVAIYVAPMGEAPMQVVDAARLESGHGIAGDRYYTGTGTFSEKLRGHPDSEVTLIESEQVERFNRLTGLGLEPGALRRNVVTAGIGLNELVGARFRVGEAVLEGLRLCEPCAHLAALVAQEVLPTLVGRAGLRARIVVGGTVRPSDAIDAMREQGNVQEHQDAVEF
jgi:MOSC domain-containing protein YiiM